jgi:hypothetical protein
MAPNQINGFSALRRPGALILRGPMRAFSLRKLEGLDPVLQFHKESFGTKVLPFDQLWD